MCGLGVNDYTISSLVFLSLLFFICSSDAPRALECLKRGVFVAQNLANDILECLEVVRHLDHRLSGVLVQDLSTRPGNSQSARFIPHSNQRYLS